MFDVSSQKRNFDSCCIFLILKYDKKTNDFVNIQGISRVVMSPAKLKMQPTLHLKS
jgi:hypothetical protein